MTLAKRSRAAALAAARRRAARTCRLARGGAAAVEFGLLAPILILTILATIEFGLYIGARVELEQALRAGAQYALKDHVDAAAITAAVQSATDLAGIVVTVNPLACECPGGVSTPCRGEANYGLCAGGILPAGYIVIAGATIYEPLFADLSWFPLDPNISETLTMRVM